MTVEAIKPRFSEALTHTTCLVNRILSNETAPSSNLSSLQINLLISLRIDKKMPLSEVSRHTGTNQNERTALILPIYEQGYITSHPYPTEPGIKLTRKGEDLIRLLLPDIESAEQIALKGFSQKEKEQLLSLLNRIQKNCNTRDQ